MPFTVIRKALTESLISEVLDMRFQSGMLQFTRDNVVWEDLAALGSQFTSVVAETLAPGSPATATLDGGILTFGIPAGGQGADGMPGTPGTNGADGLPIELFVEGGFIKWRLQGEAGGIILVSLNDLRGADGECLCDEDEEIPPQNLQMNRCGVAVALTLELKRLYQRIKADPTAWDAIEDISGQIGTTYNTASAAAAATAAFLGVTVSGGVAVVGGLIAAGIGLINWVSGRANNGIDNWTLLTEEFLQESLYCVLSRRETVTITADVLREWIGYVNDADISGDNDYLIQFLSRVPVQYWQNEATVAQADINSCLNTCETREGAWAYQIGEGLSDLLNWNEPLIAASATILQGVLDDYQVSGIPTPLNTLLYTVRLRFGRLVNISELNIDVSYRQSRDASSPVISVLGDGSPLTSLVVDGVSEITGDIASLCWQSVNPLGYDQFSEITVSGTIAVTDANVNAGEYLHLDFVRLCGRDYAPFGEEAINEAACESCPEPTWRHEFPFGSGAQGWVGAPSTVEGQLHAIFSGGQWIGNSNSNTRHAIGIRRQFPTRTITAVEMTVSSAMNGNRNQMLVRDEANTNIATVADTTIFKRVEINTSLSDIRVFAAEYNTGGGTADSYITKISLEGLGTDPFI